MKQNEQEMIPSDLNVGDPIEYRAAGKVARLDGVAGRWMPAMVIEIRDNGDVAFRKNHDSIVPNGVANLHSIRR